jgi:hypothetical protein
MYLIQATLLYQFTTLLLCSPRGIQPQSPDTVPHVKSTWTVNRIDDSRTARQEQHCSVRSSVHAAPCEDGLSKWLTAQHTTRFIGQE